METHQPNGRGHPSYQRVIESAHYEAGRQLNAAHVWITIAKADGGISASSTTFAPYLSVSQVAYGHPYEVSLS
jgi:hypothetical protein